jgi:hypothetical protein
MGLNSIISVLDCLYAAIFSFFKVWKSLFELLNDGGRNCLMGLATYDLENRTKSSQMFTDDDCLLFFLLVILLDGSKNHRIMRCLLPPEKHINLEEDRI